MAFPVPAIPSLPPALNPQASPAQPVRAGAAPQFDANGAGNNVIDLDSDTYKNKDPAEALKEAFKANTNSAFDDKLANFALNKGFIKDKNNSVELHAYSNPPGPECYYLTRKWTINYTDAAGKPQSIAFTKKIYTSVEIPHGKEGHEQKQYMAALAARTYANVVESMIKNNAGTKDDLYQQFGHHMSKIAKDRFVTMEMFNGQEKITVNPKQSTLRKPKIENQKITTVVLNIRSGNKRENELIKSDASKDKTKLELEQDIYPQINLISLKSKSTLQTTKADEFYKKPYVLKSDANSSSHVKEMSVLLRNEEIIKAVKEGELSPEEACHDAGVSFDQFKAINQEQLNRTASEFYQHARFFKFKNEIPSLMESFGRDPDSRKPITIQDQTFNILPPKQPEGVFERTKAFVKKKELKDLELLEAIGNLAQNPITSTQQRDLNNLINAYNKTYEEMLKLDEKIIQIEDDFKEMGVEVKEEQRVERQKLLNNVGRLLNKAGKALKSANVEDSSDSTSDLESSQSRSASHVSPNQSQVDSSDEDINTSSTDSESSTGKANTSSES